MDRAHRVEEVGHMARTVLDRALDARRVREAMSERRQNSALAQQVE